MGDIGSIEKLHSELAASVRGGRVASTPFLPPEDAARLAALLRAGGIAATCTGGFPGARRRVVTARPAHVPEAARPLSAVYYAAVHDEQELRRALKQAGVADDAVGDVLPHRDGMSAVLLASESARALALEHVMGRPAAGESVPLELVATGKVRSFSAVVPSLRVDALGARAFGVSRSYFGKGLASGKVRLDGDPAGKSSVAEVGAEVDAEGLGRFFLRDVRGATKRGNVKVELEVEHIR